MKLCLSANTVTRENLYKKRISVQITLYGYFLRSQKKFFEKVLDKSVLTVYTVYIQYEGSEQMNIFIDNRSGAPIYDQIYNQVKDLIISGELRENDPLPSIRSLAKDMRISVVTTKRAYDELEREGLIYTLPAKGCFVAPQNTEILREQHLKKIEEHILEIKKLAASCKLTKEDIIVMFDILDEQE